MSSSFGLLLLSLPLMLMLACGVRAVEYKICVVLNETDTCNMMAADMKNLDNGLKCVYGRDKIDCMKKVVSMEADIVNLAANEAYVAARNYALKPIVQEERDGNNDGVMYEAVAIVKKSAGIKSLADLKGKRSCHTGYQRNAGWSIPVSILRSETMGGAECDEIAAVSGFFVKSCVPGAWSSDADMDEEIKRKYSNLCEMCKSKCRGPEDEFLGYEGALKCLTETDAEVAFTKLVTARSFFAAHPKRSEYAYLCLNGTALPVDAPASASYCAWASRPNNLVVTRSNMSDGELEGLRKGLLQLFSRFQLAKPAWMAKTIVSNNSVTTLSPEQRNVNDILTKHNFLVTIEKPLPKTCVENPVKVCVTSTLEMDKCVDLKAAAFAQRLRPLLACHMEDSVSKCFAAIKDGRADVVAADSGEVFRANKEYNLVPIMSEVYGKENASYYAVAVVRAPSAFLKPEDLRGKRSCHTGFRRTAGWNVPVGTLKKDGLIKASACKAQNGAAKFFSESCVPGVKGQEALCKLCAGNEQGQHKCDATSQERYYGYSGAFRCLAEKAGDVAFVKHTTVDENLRADRPPWAAALLKSDFALLCLDGRTDSVDNYRDCNWAKVASHKVVANGNRDASEIMSIKALFLRASAAFGPNKDLFKMLGNYHGIKDLLFKDSATGLQAVPSYATIVDVLGKDLYDDLDATYCAANAASGRHLVSWTSVLLMALCFLGVFVEQRRIW